VIEVTPVLIKALDHVTVLQVGAVAKVPSEVVAVVTHWIPVSPLAITPVPTVSMKVKSNLSVAKTSAEKTIEGVMVQTEAPIVEALAQVAVPAEAVETTPERVAEKATERVKARMMNFI